FSLHSGILCASLIVRCGKRTRGRFGGKGCADRAAIRGWRRTAWFVRFMGLFAPRGGQGKCGQAGPENRWRPAVRFVRVMRRRARARLSAAGAIPGAAAGALGVDDRTGRRWTKLPGYAAELAKARARQERHPELEREPLPPAQPEPARPAGPGGHGAPLERQT